MNNWFNKNGIHLGIVAIFIVICFVYFAPAFSGKVLFQSDVQQAQAGQTEIMKYKAQDGKAPLWTNSMFGGMPTYQIWTQYPNNITTYILEALKWALPHPADTLLLYLLGAYLLFCVLGLSPWLAAAGAVAFAFSSYNFIIIDAGHTNKAVAIAFFAPIIAGIILTFRGKFWWGAFLTALFLALEIRSNHIQMTYYLFLALIILAGFELYDAIKNKTLPSFAKSLAYLTAGVILAVALNASMLWTTYEYGQLSNRGKSNLTIADKTQPTNGLDKEYAYGWSQGVGECITFLIPNGYGGASGPMLNDKSEVAKALIAKGADASQAAGFAQQMPVYWGDKAFTSGPWYFGAFVVFLFVFGLFVVKGKLKWWLLSATLLSILLSFGKNFTLVSDFFFNNFPLYNKFRAVESTLVIAGLCVPILACLAIYEATKTKIDEKQIIKSLKTSGYIVVGFVLVLTIAPSILFTFKSAQHQEFIGMLKQGLGGDEGFANSVANALVADRIALFKVDAIRSLIIIVVGIGLLWAAITKKISANIAYILMGFLILGDMWLVDKRYLNDNKFIIKSEIEQQKQPRQVDFFIMQDKDPDFRVFDMTASPFSSANASFFHKSIGGYHAAKLKRFNEVIDKQFTGSINQDVLDMLNTRYFITNGKDGKTESMERNNTACGNAWFVNSIKFAKDNDEEMQAISSFNPQSEAIINQEFEKNISKNTGAPLNGMIKLTSYRPDVLKYEYSIDKNAVAIFSEIWYPQGWKMYVDGVDKSYFRANYLLRAAELPAGNHTIEWKFLPNSYYLGEKISLCASITLFLAFCLLIYSKIKNKKLA
ncbi:MAG: hypothetical protein EAZ15_10275 [Sphingobacteriales bacterium]|nr:MAG: hypothetical protein EAZ15_10275 [Sphingobacteriales bacterium]